MTCEKAKEMERVNLRLTQIHSLGAVEAVSTEATYLQKSSLIGMIHGLADTLSTAYKFITIQGGKEDLKSTNMSDMVMEYSDSLVHCGGPNVRGITRDVSPIDTSTKQLDARNIMNHGPIE